MNDTYRLSQKNPMLEETTSESSAAAAKAAVWSQVATTDSSSRPAGNAIGVLRQGVLPCQLMLGGLLLLLGLGAGVAAVDSQPTNPANMVPGWLVVMQAHAAGADWVSVSGWGQVLLRDYLLSGFLFALGSLFFWQDERDRKKRPALLPRFWKNSRRAFGLVLLGIFLQSLGAAETRWVLTDPFSQIGLASWLWFLLSRGSDRSLLIFAGLLVLIPSIGIATGPVVGNLAAVESSASSEVNPQEETAEQTDDLPLAAEMVPAAGSSEGNPQWSREQNRIWQWEMTWLPLLPGQPDLQYQQAGRIVSAFLPATALLLLGSWTARRQLRNSARLRLLLGQWVLCGAGMLVTGVLLHRFGWPAIERLMSASWVLIAGGYSLLVLAGCLFLINIFPGPRWLALVIRVGQKPLLLSLFGWGVAGWLSSELLKHLHSTLAQFAGQKLLPLPAVLLQLLLPGLLMLILAMLLSRKKAPG